MKMKPQPSLKQSPVKGSAERVVKDSIADLCHKAGIDQSLYYTWSKEFMEAGKRRLARISHRI
jgi:transposase